MRLILVRGFTSHIRSLIPCNKVSAISIGVGGVSIPARVIAMPIVILAMFTVVINHNKKLPAIASFAEKKRGQIANTRWRIEKGIDVPGVGIDIRLMVIQNRGEKAVSDTARLTEETQQH
jgi:hypothetical protein